MESIYQGVLRQFANQLEAGSVVVRRGASQDVLFEFPDSHFDFIYIDGDHEYAAVRQDCFLAYEKVRTGGYICGDDYSIGGWWKDGVVRAFHELIAEKPVIIRSVRGNQIVLEKLR
jgi:predicted O-methyltransferase YrrM